MIHLSWDKIEEAADRVARTWAERDIFWVYGPPMGGLPVATLVAARLQAAHVVNLDSVPERERHRCLVVDDLVDSGHTMTPYAQRGFAVDALFRKPHSPSTLAPSSVEQDGWLVFPWESEDAPESAVVRILEHIGEDPTRDGLVDTPRRVIKAMRELTCGYAVDPADVLSTTFDVDHDEMIVVRRVPFSSLCEHHMLPFHGHATVAYVPAPGGRIVGLSKLARLVDLYARRLQVQERLTDQIAKAIDDHLSPIGVGVIVTASHTCMSMRGIERAGEMVTAKMSGVMREKPEARAELMALHGA